MSNRSWTCVLCGWTGTTIEADYTEAGAKRCPACRSGALVLTDPERELRNATGVAKRLTNERRRSLERRVPLLLWAGIERVEPVTAEQVLERRDHFEREGAIWQKAFDRRNAEVEALGLRLRKELAERVGPSEMAILDERRLRMPRDGAYTADYWRNLLRRHEDGSLTAELTQELADEAAAPLWRARVAELVSPAELERLDGQRMEFRSTRGSKLNFWWRCRLRDLLRCTSVAPDRLEAAWNERREGASPAPSCGPMPATAAEGTA